jgi:hypothetical protein
LQFISESSETVKGAVLKAIAKLNTIKAGVVSDAEFAGAVDRLTVDGFVVEGMTKADVVSVAKAFGKASVCCVGPDDLPWVDELGL